jgi:hypothetical protein
MKRFIAILAMIALLTGLVPLASINVAASTGVSGSIQQIPWPEFPMNTTADPAAMFTGNSLYLISGIFNGWAISNMSTETLAVGTVTEEGIFSFVEMFGGEATGSSFLARFVIDRQNASQTDGHVAASLDIIAGSGNYAHLNGNLNLKLELRYQPYFYQALWSGVYSGGLNNLH